MQKTLSFSRATFDSRQPLRPGSLWQLRQNIAQRTVLGEALLDAVEHELQYTHGITILKEVYVESLLHDAQSPRPQLFAYTPDSVIFFATISNLVTIHANLARANTTDADGLDPHQSFAKHIAVTFARYSTMLQLYGQYVAKYTFIRQTISEGLRKQEADPIKYRAFHEFLSDAKATGRVGDDPSAALMLLLEQSWSYPEQAERNINYLFALVKSHPTLNSVFLDAVRNMRKTMEHVQEQEQIAANSKKMHLIEETWSKKFTQPGRVFLREGNLTKISRQRDIVYVFVLFSDMLMYGAATAVGKVVHHRSLALRTMGIQDEEETPASFAIISDEKSFTVRATSTQDKQEWEAALVAAISRVSSGQDAYMKDQPGRSSGPGRMMPVWKQDKVANCCYYCNEAFTFMNRRHHCRRCGELVCNNCSQFRLPLNKLVATNKSGAMERACQKCAEEVLSVMPTSEAQRFTRAMEARRTSIQPALSLFLSTESWSPTSADSGMTGDTEATIMSPSIVVDEGGFESTSIPSPPTSPTFVSKPGGTKSKRQLVVEEMLSTEKLYVDNLQTINELFVQPLLADAQSSRPSVGKICELMSENKLASMGLFLHSLQQLLAVNGRFLADLTERLTDWTDSKTIGDIFAHYAPLFAVYSQYTDAQEFASQTIVDFQERSREFKDFLEDFESNPRTKQTLQSFLIKPIQRVPRYQLLLQECLRQTEKLDPAHPDLELIAEGLELVKDSATYINAVVHIRENKTRIFELERGWSGYKLSKPGRKLIREGVLTKQCRRSPKDFYFLLFNDILVYGEADPTGTVSFIHHRVIDLSNCKVEEPSVASAASGAFQVLSKEKAFVAYTRDESEKELWMRDIRAAIEALLALKGASYTDQAFAAVWVPDAHARECTLCNRGFTVLLRRHHCRECGRVCCDGCSSHRVVLEHLDATVPVRVCDICAQSRGLIDTPAVLDTDECPYDMASEMQTQEDPAKGSLEADKVEVHSREKPAPSVPVEDFDSSDEGESEDSQSDEEESVEGDGLGVEAPGSARPSFAVHRRRASTHDAVGMPITSFPARVYVMYDFFPQEEGEIMLRHGTTLEASEAHGEWIHLRDEAGNQGWAPRKYVSTTI